MKLRRALGVLLLALLPAGAAAQTTTGTLKGRVFDRSGTALPGVIVQCESPSRGGSRSQAVTDMEGNYLFPLLPPATDYMVTVSYPGFAEIIAGPVALQSGRTRLLDLTLSSDSESTETVRVEAHGRVIDTDSTRTSTSYNAEFIEGLPIIGHDYQDILTLAPGVTDTDGDGNPNVHGARDTGMQYRLDGGNITDPLSGHFGQNLNADIIEEIEVITSGASAEYGRADGGFANIITKSGGNDFEGKFSLFWRGRFLDGDGASNNDVNRFQNTFPDFRDIRPTLTLGGAIVKDKVWYFGSAELLDTEQPVNQIGSNILITTRGQYSFAKITWQADLNNKLALQVSADPVDWRGLGLDQLTSPESDYVLGVGGLTPQVRWTSVISPRLLVETAVTHYSKGVSVTPVSRYFQPVEVRLIRNTDTRGTVQALYPCDVINCDPSRGERTIYQLDTVTGRTSGPFFFKGDDSRDRNAIKSDLSYTIEDAWGQHTVKSGFEFADERYLDRPVFNPTLVDNTEVLETFDRTSGRPDALAGNQTLLVFDPLLPEQRAKSFNSSAYVIDSWKPRPNLSLMFGLRLDLEEVDTQGFDYFDPRSERLSAMALWDAVCAEAHAQNLGTLACSGRLAGNPPSQIPDNSLRAFVDRDSDGLNDVDPRVAALDLNSDGIIQMSGEEGRAQFADFTRVNERETENFSLSNRNFAPRFSFSWDPAADGRTKVFGTWGRYFDRLFLDTVSGEMNPDLLTFTFFPESGTNIFNVNPRSSSSIASQLSITQVDRGIRTPYVDEYTLGFERELAPEWSAGVTYIRRKGRDLLQDLDVNHLACPQYGDVLGIDPLAVCGDAGYLETDRFGRVATSGPRGGIQAGSFMALSVMLPNGAPDLYTISPNFNQVLLIGNFNSSDYEAWELKLLKRLHRNWQLQASYTWSNAFGQAEDFLSLAGDDPETVDDEEGYLDYDQRHVLKFQAVGILPGEIRLGTIVQWESGTPYSVTQIVPDQDQLGNINIRRFFPTGQRNDQRNTGRWKIDGRVEKSFTMGRLQASGFLLGENLLNSDDLEFSRIGNAATATGVRRFGRRWELGLVVAF